MNESTTPPESSLSRWQWILLAALCLLALSIRVLPRFNLVFQPGFVNFQETDAWYHVRVAENLIRHFPFRMTVDPYVVFGEEPDTVTPPFYDWLLGLIAWLAGAGAPSESLLHIIAAWYPAVLGVLTVLAVFILAKLVFGLRAALEAAAIIATLPGHFLRVSSLGFTDHHIMESLLVTLFFYLLLRAIQTIQAPKSIGIISTPSSAISRRIVGRRRSVPVSRRGIRARLSSYLEDHRFALDALLVRKLGRDKRASAAAIRSRPLYPSCRRWTNFMACTSWR